MNLTVLKSLFKQTFTAFSSDDAFSRSAALAYYAVFSLPGLFLIVISVSSLLFSEQEVLEKVGNELSDKLGENAASDFQSMYSRINTKGKTSLSATLGIASLVFGATGFFIQLQNALNVIWDVRKTAGKGLLRMLKDRFTSLGLVLVMSFLLLLSLVMSTAIGVFNTWIADNFSLGAVYITYALQAIISIGIITFLFASIYKYLPDVDLTVREVRLGAFFTAILFTGGKELIAFYISFSDPGSGFGAGSSIVLFLLWIYYSCLILLFGAEFTQIYARWKGIGIHPSKNATFARRKSMTLPDLS